MYVSRENIVCMKYPAQPTPPNMSGSELQHLFLFYLSIIKKKNEL